MTAEVSDITPKVITAGLNADWKRYYKDYLFADSWVVTYYIIANGAQITITGTDNGDSYHRFTKLASATTDYIAGEYSYTAVAINGTSKVPVEAGIIRIETNFITATGGFDARSKVKVILDNLDAVILELSKTTATEVTINSKSYKRSSLNELIKTRSHYATLYQQELNALSIAQGFPDKNKIWTRFVAR